MRRAIPALVLVTYAILSGSIFAEPTSKVVHAQVLQIVDGDSVTVSMDGELERVRLADIDAPEHDQPFSTDSRQSLFDLCLWVHAELTSNSRDHYGRTIARVKCNGVDVNAEQVRRGLAWVKTNPQQTGRFTRCRTKPVPRGGVYGRVNRPSRHGNGIRSITINRRKILTSNACCP